MPLDPSGFEIKERYSAWQKKIVRTIVVNAHSKSPLQRSIASAISIAKPYDRIELVGGEYLEALSISYPVEIVASDGEEPHIVSRNTAVTITADIQVYFENIEMSSKSKSKIEVGAAIFSGHPIFVDCKFNSVLIGAKARVSMENCYIRKSANGVGLSVRDEASGVLNNCTISSHSQACVEINTLGEFLFSACSMSNRRTDGGDVFVASGLGNRYGQVEPCSRVTLSHCRLHISQDGGGKRLGGQQKKDVASFAVEEPCCAVISNGAAPTLDQNRFLEGEVGVLLHHAGSAKLTHNMIQSQRRCGIAALLQPIRSDEDLEEKMYGHTGLKITGDNVIDRCFIGIDIHTRAIPKKPTNDDEENNASGGVGTSVNIGMGAGNAASAAETEYFAVSSTGVQSHFSWLGLPEVGDARVPSTSSTTAVAQRMAEDRNTTVYAHGRRVSLLQLQYQLRALATMALQVFPACLNENFGERVSSTATTGVVGNYFSKLLFDSLGLLIAEESKNPVCPLAEFAKEISVSHTIFQHCGMCAIRFGCNSYGSVEQCTFDENDRHAIIVSSGAYPVITGCTFTHSSRSSILVGGYANPLVIGNMMKEGGKDAIEVTQLGRGIYIANHMGTGAGAGMVISHHSDPVICANMIKKNTGGGILISHGSMPLVAYNVLSVNSIAQVRYDHHSDPWIIRNSIQSGLGIGVLCRSLSRGLIMRNHIISNKCGVAVESGADPVVTLNQIEKNMDIGVHVLRKGLGTITQNEIEENGTNVVIMEGGDCVLRANKITKGGQGGVVVRKEGKGTIEKNTIRENSVANLLITDLNSSPWCDRNTICASSGCGVIVASGADGTLTQNKIFENGFCGIYVRTFANPICTQNHVSREAVGVMVTHNGKGEFTKNLVYHIFGIGFITQRKGQPIVRVNIFQECDLSGLQVGLEGGGVIEQNRMVGGRFGMQVGSTRGVDDIPLTSAYYDPHFELPQRRKSELLLAGVVERILLPVVVRNNDITDNTQGGILLQSSLDCVVEDNRIFHNGSFGILADTKFWEKARVSSQAMPYANLPHPKSSHGSSGRGAGNVAAPKPTGTRLSRNVIRYHETSNVHFACFVEPGVHLEENDIFDAPVGVSIANQSCLEMASGNHIHDCLDGVHVISGGFGQFMGNKVSHCAHVGLYLFDGGRPTWEGGNVIEYCMLCGILSDAGASGSVRQSTVRQCTVGIIALCSVGLPLHTRPDGRVKAATTLFEQNTIMEHVLHGVVLLCTPDPWPFRVSEENQKKTAASAAAAAARPGSNSRLSTGQMKQYRNVRFLKNTIKDNRACGVYIDYLEAGDIDPAWKAQLSLSEISTKTTMEALLGTSLLGTTEEHHEERARSQPYLEENHIRSCSIGISVGSLCHPFVKNNRIVENIFLGMTLRAGSAAMVFGGEVAHNGIAGIYAGKGAKGTVSDVHIHHNNKSQRPSDSPGARRDFSRTALVTVLGMWEAVKNRVVQYGDQGSTPKPMAAAAAASATFSASATTRFPETPVVTLHQKEEARSRFDSSYQWMNRWLGVQRFAMTDAITLLRQLMCAASDAVGIATATVPSKQYELENQKDPYGFLPETRPKSRLLYVSDGGIGIWAEQECRTTFQRNVVEHHHQVGIFFGKGIRSFHLALYRSSPLDEVTSTSTALWKEWDFMSLEQAPDCASRFPAAFFSSESLFVSSPALAASAIPAGPGVGRSRSKSEARDTSPVREPSAYVDPSENEFTPIKTGRFHQPVLSNHSKRKSHTNAVQEAAAPQVRLTPREMRDNQRHLTIEQNTIRLNAQGMHIQLVHRMVGERQMANDSKRQNNSTNGGEKAKANNDNNSKAPRKKIRTGEANETLLGPVDTGVDEERCVTRNGAGQGNEFVLHVRDNTIHQNFLTGIHCQHVVEIQCQDNVSCSLALSDAIHSMHSDICRDWTQCKMFGNGSKSTPPFVDRRELPFLISDRLVSGRRSARITHNDLSGNKLTQCEVTSQYVVIGKDNSKSLLQFDTFTAANISYRSSQVLYRIPLVAALFQYPPSGTFLLDENKVHDCETGIRCFGPLCSDNVRIFRNEFSGISKDAVAVLGHLAAATIGPENTFTRNHVGVRVHVDVPSKASFLSDRSDYETRVFRCVFSEQKLQAVVVDGVGSIPALICRNTFKNHGYGSVAMLLYSTAALARTASVVENEFTDSFSPLVVMGEDLSVEAVKGREPHSTTAKNEKALPKSSSPQPEDPNSSTSLLPPKGERLLLSRNSFKRNVIGALVCNGANPHFSRNTFTQNTRAGLEICGIYSFPTVDECVFRHNTTADALKSKPQDSRPTTNHQDKNKEPMKRLGAAAAAVEGQQSLWNPSKAEIVLNGIPLPISVSPSNVYTIGSTAQPLACGLLLNPESQCIVKRCLYERNDVGVDVVRCVLPSSSERTAYISRCIFHEHHAAGVMVRFCKTVSIRESAMALTNGNIPKETTIFEGNFFFDNASDANKGLGDVVSREFGAAVFRKNIFCGTVHGKEDGFAWFDSNSFLPEATAENPPEVAIVLHNDTKIVATRNLIGKRKTGIESRSFAGATMTENIILQCDTGIRALPLSLSKFSGNRVLDSTLTGIVAYSGEYIENEVVFAKNGIWVEDASLSKANNAIPAHRRQEGKVSLLRNRICSCEGEGILLSTQAEIAGNVVQFCGTGVHIIALNNALPKWSDTEDEWPIIRSNSLLMNRMGLVAEDYTVTMIKDNDIFDNAGIGVSVEAQATGKLQGNRISTNKEEDATVIPSESKMKIINNTIRHRFSPVFNRISHAARKKEITDFMNAVAKEVELWNDGWNDHVMQQQSLFSALATIDPTRARLPTQQQTKLDDPMSLTVDGPVAGSASLALRRFSTSASNLRLAIPGTANGRIEAGNNDLSKSSLSSHSTPKHNRLGNRLHRSSSLLSSSTPRIREPTAYSSQGNHQHRASRRGAAIPLLLHIITRPNGHTEANRWGHELTKLLAQPPLDQKHFQAIFTFSKAELSRTLEEEKPSVVLVLMHRSCTTPSTREECEVLQVLHQYVVEAGRQSLVPPSRGGKASSPPAAPLPPILIGMLPEREFQNDVEAVSARQAPSEGGEMTRKKDEKSETMEGPLSIFAATYRTLFYRETIAEVLDANFPDVLMDALRAPPPTVAKLSVDSAESENGEAGSGSAGDGAECRVSGVNGGVERKRRGSSIDQATPPPEKKYTMEELTELMNQIDPADIDAVLGNKTKKTKKKGKGKKKSNTSRSASRRPSQDALLKGKTTGDEAEKGDERQPPLVGQRRGSVSGGGIKHTASTPQKRSSKRSSSSALKKRHHRSSPSHSSEKRPPLAPAPVNRLGTPLPKLSNGPIAKSVSFSLD